MAKPINYSIILEPDLYERMSAAASRSQRTLASWIRYVAIKELERTEDKEKAS